MNDPIPPRPNRREALKWMLAAGSAAMLDRSPLLGQPAEQAKTEAKGDAKAETEAELLTGPIAKGYGTDPDLLKTYKPGDVWPLTFDDSQRFLAAVLCETIIPADGTSPSAASLNVQDFIDEWISAPYPSNRRDRKTVLEGLAWIDQEAIRRFGVPFGDLIVSQRHAIFDDICSEAKVAPQFKSGAKFFKKFRDLTAGGFYTTPQGMKDIGYIGNVPLSSFDGPPADLIAKLGLEDAVIA